MNELKQYGKTLAQRGYQVVPIAVGAKSPSIKGWQKTHADLEQVAQWLECGHGQDGVGVLTKLTPCVDIDVQDEAAVKAIVARVRDVAGDAPLRVGRAPKCALYFRADAPVKKMSSKAFFDDEGRKHQVEILGDGQQSVVFAVHPDTKQPYEWVGKSLADISHDVLPTLSAEQGLSIVQWFEEFAAQRGWRPTPNHGGGDKPKAQETDYAGEALKFLSPVLGDEARERLAQALEVIDPDCDYSEWVKVGMGLHHEYGGSEEGFSIWLAWSARGMKFAETDEQRMRGKWQSFGERRDRDLVTARSIFALANTHSAEPVEDALSRFLKRYVYVQLGHEVADLCAPPQHCISPMIVWRESTADERVLMPAPTKNDPERMKYVPVAELWRTSPERIRVRGARYFPEEERIFEDDGMYWVNIFYMQKHRETFNDELLEHFFNHMRYLVPDEIDRKWFIGWIARIIQNPRQRCHVVPLHISPVQGTGRGWVLQLIERLLGAHNVHKAQMSEFVDSQYTGFLAECLVLAVEEVQEAGQRFTISEKIKEKVEAKRLMVNHKYGAQGVEPIFANVLLLSNHRDAVALPPSDRRTYVIDGANEVLPTAYYTTMYNLLERDDFIATVFTYLRGLDLSGIDFWRPRHNEARQRLIESGQSDTEQLFNLVWANPPFGVMQQGAFIDAMRERAEEIGMDALDINEAQAKRLFKLNAGVKVNVKIDGKVKSVFVLDTNLKGNTSAIRAEAIAALSQDGGR